MKRSLVREEIDGDVYEYIPLGKYIVSAPGVCRGRPTFKYTRIEVAEKGDAAQIILSYPIV